LIFVYIYHRLSIIELKSIYLIGIIAALTIIGASIGSFVFIEAQNITSNATNSSNMTAGANTTMTGQSGNISGIENPGM
jgi:hypothetical protein